MLVADFKRCASISAGCCEEAETAAETMAALAASAPASACLELAAAAAAPLETASTGLLVDLLVDPRGLAARFFSALLALGFLDAPPPPPRGLAAPAELEATAQLPADLGVLRPVVARGVVLPEPRAVERPDVLGEEALLIGGTYRLDSYFLPIAFSQKSRSKMVLGQSTPASFDSYRSKFVFVSSHIWVFLKQS